ncbi:MAG: exo-alpha-sialidase [Paenibacillaceae bacterium]|nr:exo-alpha-sialidase [Paenibacillaceae bacterium]
MPEPIKPPLVGPSFEMNAPIVSVQDGRWLLATSTWRGWDGECPNGMKMVAFVSADRGRTWPAYSDVMDGGRERVIFWESKLLELFDRRLLAVAWTYNEAEGCDLPEHYAISVDGGRTFTNPRSTGLIGQTPAIALTDAGGILTVYRRTDRHGLWANLSRLDGDEWVNETELPLWGARELTAFAPRDNMVDNFHELRFGAPSICRMIDGRYFVSFWAVEDGVSVIRWMRLRIA